MDFKSFNSMKSLVMEEEFFCPTAALCQKIFLKPLVKLCAIGWWI